VRWDAKRQERAWYILSAQPGAQIGAGLKHQVTPQQCVRRSRNGAIADLVPLATGGQRRRHLHPAGTSTPSRRHRGWLKFSSAATRPSPVRLWPAARIDEDNGIAVAHPCRFERRAIRHAERDRTVRSQAGHFILERVELPAELKLGTLAQPETWMLILDGHAAIGLAAASIGEAILWWRPHQHRGSATMDLTRLCVSRKPPDRFPVCRD